jgi:hypothetical protein
VDKTNIPLSGFGAAAANVTLGSFQLTMLQNQHWHKMQLKTM